MSTPMNDDLKERLRQAKFKLEAIRQHRAARGQALAEPHLTIEEIDTLLRKQS